MVPSSPKRRNERTRVAQTMKRAMCRAKVRIVCAVCGWSDPVPRERGQSAVAVHHVVPVCCGGSDDAENIALLCPNHHAVAHAVGLMHGNGQGKRKGWYGDKSAGVLIARLRKIDSRIHDDEAGDVARLVAERVDPARPQVGGDHAKP